MWKSQFLCHCYKILYSCHVFKFLLTCDLMWYKTSKWKIWNLASEVSSLWKLDKHPQPLHWARVALIICTCPHFIQSSNHFECSPPRCTPSAPDACSSVQKSGISVAPEMVLSLLASLWGHRVRISTAALILKSCEAATDHAGPGAALPQSSWVYCGTILSQSSRACARQPFSARSHPLKDAACSCVCGFRGAFFSKFLSQALPPLFVSPQASETNQQAASETSWPFSCSGKLCSLSWELFWLQTQPIWVCLTAGMFSNSTGACLSSAFCFLQHSEIIK